MRVERGMTPAQVEDIVGPPLKVVTADTDEKTLELGPLGVKPDPDDPCKKVYYYEGPTEEDGKLIQDFAVEFGQDNKVIVWYDGTHTNQDLRWVLRGWLRKILNH